MNPARAAATASQAPTSSTGTQPNPSTDERKMRADARRNYDKILATARVVFAEQGADCSLDAIAKRAGVGPGTLYRHFPTRDALVSALMEDWSGRVRSDAEAAVAAGLSPRETLQTWLGQFVGHLTLHRGAAAKLCAAMDQPTSPIYRKCRVMADANAQVIEHLAASGALRPGVDPDNVMRLVGGIASVADTTSTDLDVGPMLDVVIDGVIRD